MRLTTRGRYAVMAMVDLASHAYIGKPLVLADVANRQEIQLPYLEQIFAQLRRNGLVMSVRGPGGGYRLGRDSSEISIADIMKAVEEETTITRCEGKQSDGCMTNQVRCLTHHLWEGLGRHIDTYLSQIKLADLSKTKQSSVEVRIGSTALCSSGEADYV